MKKILRPLLMAALLVAGIHVFAQNHTYVDLGLPSGTLWATCNVGANKPEECGEYFAWGETAPKTTYSMVLLKYVDVNNKGSLTKYCNISSLGYNGLADNLITLQPSDDAATANWGSEWRMPTKEEWEELKQHTTCQYTTQNNVEGRLFTASNGQSIFLPAAGFRSNDEVYDTGKYWSSSLDTVNPFCAWCFGFGSGSFETVGFRRNTGMSIRPVRSSK